ncbi:MAG: dihydroneopterin aldolase, partial [Chloroflexi bacterium]|nr:dihydroneopterin aldolase [Chloroflexota bacterium]
LALPRVQAARVTVHKPHAPIKGAVFQDVAVEIERRRTE